MNDVYISLKKIIDSNLNQKIIRIIRIIKIIIKTLQQVR